MNDGMGYGHWYACHEKMQKHLKAKKQKQKHSAPVWIQCWIVVSCYAAVAALIDQHWTKALWCVWVGLCVGVAALRDWHRTFTCHDLNEICAWGFARIWAAIAGFRVQSANRYTTGPDVSASSMLRASGRMVLCSAGQSCSIGGGQVMNV